MKQRQGRGFTLDELKAAGINRREARGVGISVDHRRKNRSEEGFKLNVARLTQYKSKLIIFPRNPTSKRVKKGDSTREECKNVKQVNTPHAIPMPKVVRAEKARLITDAEREAVVRDVLRKAHTDAKLIGKRARRKQLKDQQGLSKKPKADTAGDDD